MSFSFKFFWKLLYIMDVTLYTGLPEQKGIYCDSDSFDRYSWRLLAYDSRQQVPCYSVPEWLSGM